MSSTNSPVYSPPLTTHTHTVVFLHGRGDNALDFARSLNYSRDSQNRTLADAFPTFRWVFPRAKLSKSVALPGGAEVSQWFDICNASNFAEREELQAEGLRDSVPHIREIIAGEAEMLGGRYDHVILAGISQGAATSVQTLLNLKLPNGQERLGSFLGFSCRMPFPGRSLGDTRAILGLSDVPEGDDVLRYTPILLEHCVDDGTVPIALGRELRDALRRFGSEVDWKEYPDGGHWFKSPEGMDDVVRFLGALGFPGSSDAQDTRAGNTMDLS
ncbi:phospholipase carboxylesterase [Colletotrichum musicola]|uniref:Phospholipase carboxylesterase n=1 Tax=Colletotrichum musicola TaxID=2175873 RepID=A0A8H6NQM4_9PEZI|nr:phospholipase carboxylesterase [Colletotrichum musicola]